MRDAAPGDPCTTRPRTGASTTGLLILALFSVAAAEDALPAESEARRLGLAALPRLLAHVDAEDPDIRVRARALARCVVLDHYETHAPAGMRFVPGRIVVTARGATCEGFYLGTHEVTVAEFRVFALAGGLPDRWPGTVDGSLPASNVSLEEARAYAAKHNARLPTEDELHRAARGGGRLRYPWGERFDPARVNSREAGRGRPEPVGARKSGLSVQGIADLLGNVAEWTETPADRNRFVVAGGSYRWYARATPPPYKLEPSARLDDVGFRLAMSLPPLLTGAPE